MNDNYYDTTEWAIYAVIPPHSEVHTLVVAPSHIVAWELGIKPVDDILPGEILIVGNHTAEYLELSAKAAEATLRLLAEQRASRVWFDHEAECWVRLQST